MGAKQKLEKIIGRKAVEGIIKVKKSASWILSCINGNAGRIVFCDDREYQKYHLADHNVFFGYYDLQQYDEKGEKLLAHVVKKGADTSKDKAKLVWFDSADGSMHEFASTQAWCWQQGARLRWHPKEKNVVLYNDKEGNEFVLKSTNLIDGKTEILSPALYDVDKTLQNGLSLNFARLQRLRPGYGYNSITDDSVNEKASASDGVFHIDLASGRKTLYFSLENLAQDVYDDSASHYINHICISPDGSKFTFFHIWTKSAEFPLKMRFYVANMDGTNLRRLENEWRISHYSWIDNKKILTTTADGKYVIYDVETGEKTVIQSEHLVRDGHPTPIEEAFVSDTYPSKRCMQQVFRIGFNGENYKNILNIYSDPRRYGEKRCDLHPRVTSDGRITIDTTCNNGLRSIVAFRLKNDEM